MRRFLLLHPRHHWPLCSIEIDEPTAAELSVAGAVEAVRAGVVAEGAAHEANEDAERARLAADEAALAANETTHIMRNAADEVRMVMGDVLAEALNPINERLARLEAGLETAQTTADIAVDLADEDPVIVDPVAAAADAETVVLQAPAPDEIVVVAPDESGKTSRRKYRRI